MTNGSASVLTLAPEPTITGSGARANTDPARPASGAFVDRASDGYTDWLAHIWPAAGCTRPVQLRGNLATLDLGTGQVVATRHTDGMPDGVIYKPCGNRRAALCASCAEVYRRDAYQLIRAGLVGGKTVDESVAEHPACFVTFTAPSFGPVHTRVIARHTCGDRRRCSCTPNPCRARRDHPICRHGRALSCTRRHRVSDPDLGQPLCPDCYDHAGHAVWNTMAAELWRRTSIALTRHLRGLVGPYVRVSYAKVAEYQARGVVHYHALLRVDGIDPDHPDRVVAPPAGLDTGHLEEAIRHAARSAAFVTGPHPDHARGWYIAWGEQLDTRPIRLTGHGGVIDGMVAAYLAKYATKSTEATGHASVRLTAETVGGHADPCGTHVERLIAACWRLGAPEEWCRLRRWAHMLGFGGHFLTKARRYSVTFAYLRGLRATWRRSHPTTGPPDTTDHTHDQGDEDTTLVITDLVYVGVGWHTTADAQLANTAAALARERHCTAREELAHETGTATQLVALAA